MKRDAFELGGVSIQAGTRATVDLPLSFLSNHTQVNLPVHVIHGNRPGPVMFVSAAVHGDEIIGIEIVRRLFHVPALKTMAGTLLLIPIVNGFGFINHSRYLPDRRDLNRSFPGSAQGSLAAQLAHRFLNDVVQRCDFGIDLHSAAAHRTNLPQIRVDMKDEAAAQMAEKFGAPIILNSPFRDGSLREAAAQHDVPVLVYECGEALRFDEVSIRIGVKGVLRVMRHLGMTRVRAPADAKHQPYVARQSQWVRAPMGGLFRAYKTTGDMVTRGEVIGHVSDPFGEREKEVLAAISGLIVGRSNLPAVNQGDALYHIARIEKPKQIDPALATMEQESNGEALYDEDEII